MVPLTRGWTTQLDHINHDGWRLPVVAPGIIIAAGSATDADAVSLVRMRATSGDVMWDTELPLLPEATADAVADEQHVLAWTGDALVLLDARNGHVLWSHRVADAESPTLGLDSRVATARFADDHVVVVALTDGTRLDVPQSDRWAVFDITTVDARTFLLAVAVTMDGSYGATLAVFSASEAASPAWTYAPTVRAVYNPPGDARVVHDTLYLRDSPADLRAYDLRTGRDLRQSWSQAVGRDHVSGLLLTQEDAAGMVLQMRRIEATGPGDDEPRWTVYVPSTSPLDDQRSLPGNRALLLGNDLTYALIRVTDGALLWTATVADELADDACEVGGTDGRTVFVVCSGLEDAGVTAVPARPPLAH